MDLKTYVCFSSRFTTFSLFVISRNDPYSRAALDATPVISFCMEGWREDGKGGAQAAPGDRHAKQGYRR